MLFFAFACFPSRFDLVLISFLFFPSPFFLSFRLSLALSHLLTINHQVNDALAAAEALLAAAGGSSPSSGDASSSAAATRSLDKVELRCDVNGCSIVPVSSDAPARDAPPNSFFASVDEFEAAGVSGGEGGGLRARSGKAASSTQQQRASSSSPSSSSSGGAPSPVDFRLAEGPGWRLGFDAAASPGSSNFSAVAGGDGWSAAMTRDEYDDLVKLLANLQKSVATLSVCGEWGGDGGGDEAALEMSSARVWVQGRAPAARLSSLQAAWGGAAKGGPGGEGAAAPSSPLAAFELRFILLQGREVEGVWPAEAVAGVLANLEGVSSPASASASASGAAGGGGGGASGSSNAAAASSNPVAASA